MQLGFVRVIAVVVGTFVAAGNGMAADLLLNYGGQCTNYRQSVMPLMPVEEIRQSVAANLESAKAGMDDPSVLTSRQPAFIWAMEARWACSTALGYLNGGYVDEESVQKCDCFHQQYVSFR
ncbi:hypothetical protein NIM87_13315 [Devosia sp. XJ19-1]|uniref:Uncharacterized protein n=1 Tax=Devosia ureilytica TaxID=2952754 RepID=A0A9Q4AR51_9HYPH|nr:hypothetical protein [Devosia ureilytica]MCP8884493.1 hypothetical protein [Devosia ureilytica]MCP8888123.1 hypothetical protein [Devosia ureilytica]